MKARVKATGEVVELYDWCEVTEMDSYKNFTIEQLEFTLDDTNYTHDYWEKLLHQYAGMAMQGMLSNEYTHKLYLDNKNYQIGLLNDSIAIAHALVEKMKEEK